MKNHQNVNSHKLTAILLYEFKNPELLQMAITHPSKQKNVKFQRLEFLGDRILAFYISLKIFALYENSDEGELSVLFANLVSTNTIAKILSPHILPYIEYTGAMSNSIVADTFEAILAAIHLDGGDVSNIIYTLWMPYINTHKDHNFKHPKNILQEMTHNNCHYNVQQNPNNINKNKENKKKQFTAKVTSKGTTAIGEGQSKKEASENAAYNLLSKLKEL